MGGGMNPRDRVLEALNLREPDRVPVVPFIISFAAKYAGIKFIEYCRDPRRLSKAQLLTAEEFGVDAVYVDSDAVVEAEAFGADVVYFEDEVPSMGSPRVKSIEDVEALGMPDPLRDGRMPVWIEATRILSGEAGDRLGVFTNINGPFQVAAQLRGITGMCMDMYRNPELVERLLETTTEAAVRFAQAEVEAGSDAIVMGESLASPNLISPRQFERFVLPYDRKVISEVDAPFLLHICGDATLIIDLMVATGTRFLEVDTPVDLAKIREKYDNRVGIRGNVSTSLLLSGTPGEVEEAAKQCIAKAAKGGGFILGSGCEVPKNTPPANLKAMVKAAEIHGAYQRQDLGPGLV
ncbi:MAG: uroporphyrinogen decarboxylase family protein [Candidatus Bathyarchaeia archaeon]